MRVRFLTILCLGVCLFFFTEDVHAQVFDYSDDARVKGQGADLDKDRYRPMDDAFFGMSAGVSIPLGQFASDDFRNPFAGYAENGFYFSLLNGFQKFGRHFGVGLNWQRSQYDFNNEAFSQIYQRFLPQLNFQSRAEGSWIINGFTGNLVINVPHRIIDVDVRIGGGFGRVSRPEITLEGTDRNTGFLSYHWVQGQSVQTDVILGFGMNGRIHLGKTFDLLLQWDYQRMSTTMDIDNLYALSVQEREELDQQFELFNVGIGLGVRID
jgi:hypothetical protein